MSTTPTVVPVAAQLSASIAGPQRAFIQSYNHLEHLALEWLKQLLGLPPSIQGVFSSGGSVANLLGLGAARQWACEQRGIDGALSRVSLGKAFSWSRSSGRTRHFGVRPGRDDGLGVRDEHAFARLGPRLRL